MSDYAYQIYERVVNATASELVLFFVILFLFLSVVLLPLYVLILRGRKEEKQHEREREKQILEVISKNSAVIEGLRTTLDNSGETTKIAIDRVDNRIEKQNTSLNGVATNVAQITTKQTEIASKVNKILLIVDGMPSNSSFAKQNSSGQ